ALERLLEGRDLGGEPLVALRIGAQLLEPQPRRLQVARQVLQALPRGGSEPAGGEQALELGANLRRWARKRLFRAVQLLGERGVLREDLRRGARDLLRDQGETVAPFVE